MEGQAAASHDKATESTIILDDEGTCAVQGGERGSDPRLYRQGASIEERSHVKLRTCWHGVGTTWKVECASGFLGCSA